MNNAIKASCLALYLLAIVGSFGALPDAITSVMQLLAIALLAGHVLEVLLAFGTLKRHPGPLVDSIGLTLLFGFLHWWPLRGSRGDTPRNPPSA